jgi:hypothetical protein
MKSVPQPPYFPDLTSSDFYLFEYVKRCLADFSFEDADQFLAAVEGVLEGIEKVTLQAVFLAWMDRSGKSIVTKWEYTASAQINVIKEWGFILPILRSSCPGGTSCTKKANRISRQNEFLLPDVPSSFTEVTETSFFSDNKKYERRLNHSSDHPFL